MRRTLNEVYRICQKACEGAGAPDGLDIEAARGTLWLLARGFPVLEALLDDLARTTEKTDACRFDEAEVGADYLDASGKAGALLAPTLVGLLVARGNAEGSPDGIRLSGLSAPCYLLPAAADYAREGWQLHFALHTADGSQFTVRVAPAGVEILGPPGATMAENFAAGPVELEATCIRGRAELPPVAAPLEVLVAPAELVRREARALANGVDVGPELWARLSAYATRVLVPATDASRQRGAGADSKDSE